MTATVQTRGALEINGKLLTRNWGANLLGLGLPIIVALVSIPFLVRRLGPERFGILSFAWVLLGSFVIFDLGLSRATIKFVAECLGRGDYESLPRVVWTSVWSQTFLGILAAVPTGFAARFLVAHFLKVSPGLERETTDVFLILTASLPILLVGTALRGVLEAGQHFEVVNLVKIPANTSLFLLPALAAWVGWQLPATILLLVGTRLLSLAAYLFYSLRYFPGLRHGLSPDLRLLRSLLGYGGWVIITNAAAPLLIQLDRFFIGSVLSMTAVGYYAAPYEAVSRAWVIPGSLTATLFPAFTSLDASGSRHRIEELCARSVKSILLLLAPLLLLIVVFAPEVLRLWLGADFAAQSTLVLQILAVGVLINSLGLIPFSLLQGLGRPDLTAKFLLLEVPVYIGVLWLLLKKMGLPGAALAYTLRVTVDTVLLFAASAWLKSVSFGSFAATGLKRTFFSLLALAACLSLLMLLRGSLLLQVALAGSVLIVFTFVAWTYLLDPPERDLAVLAASQLRAAWGKLR